MSEAEPFTAGASGGRDLEVGGDEWACPWLNHPEHVASACLNCATDEELEQAARRAWEA